MPQRVPTIRVAPEVLLWARESAGLSQEELSKKIRSGQVNVPEWESSDSPVLVTGSQLQYIADAVKRPTAALLLDAPPQGQSIPKDFRRPTIRPAQHSSELSRAIRRARRLQRVASRLLTTLGETVSSDVPTGFNVNADPTETAMEIRKRLNISVDYHLQWNDSYGALRGWRSLIEDQNVLVFSGDFPRDEAQGFSLSDSEPCVIMLSGKDSPSARIFTLWHEFGHILIRDTGMCITEDIPYQSQETTFQRRVEDWCNRFAGAMLVDNELLRSAEQLESIVHSHSAYELKLRSLANHFKVSQYVILFRMRHLNIIPYERFRFEYDRVTREQVQLRHEQRGQRTQNVRRNISRLVVRDRGERFTRTLLYAFDRGIITHSHIVDYLGARLKHLDNIRREAHR